MPTRSWVLGAILPVMTCLTLPGAGHASETNRFLRTLATKAEASRGDCLVATALYLGKRDNLDDLQGLVSLLQEQGAIDDDEARELAPGPGREPTVDLEAPVDRGYACRLFMAAMDEDGGLLGRIFRSSDRYAYRHLEFRQMIPPGGPWVDISGPELIGLLRAALERR